MADFHNAATLRDIAKMQLPYIVAAADVASPGVIAETVRDRLLEGRDEALAEVLRELPVDPDHPSHKAFARAKDAANATIATVIPGLNAEWARQCLRSEHADKVTYWPEIDAFSVTCDELGPVSALGGLPATVFDALAAAGPTHFSALSATMRQANPEWDDLNTASVVFALRVRGLVVTTSGTLPDTVVSLAREGKPILRPLSMAALPVGSTLDAVLMVDCALAEGGELSYLQLADAVGAASATAGLACGGFDAELTDSGTVYRRATN